MTDRAPKTLWQRFRDYRISSRVSHAANVAIILANGTVAITVDNKWLGLMNAMVVGFCLSSSVFLTVFTRNREAWRKADEAFHEMADMNRALIEGKFKMMIGEVHIRDLDDEAPMAPSKLN